MSGMAMHYGLLLGGALIMFVPPFRALMRKFIFKPGQGPSKEDSAKDYLELRGTATPDLGNSGKQAFGKVWYSGSLYYSK